jgi:hypothetical protein
MTGKQQREWRAQIQKNIQNNHKPSGQLININRETDKRCQPWRSDDPRKKVVIETIIDKPSNPEHERQMRILDNAIAKSKANSIIVKPVIEKPAPKLGPIDQGCWNHDFKPGW